MEQIASVAGFVLVIAVASCGRVGYDGVPAEAILRALSQLLVEKGIITRDELVERLTDVVREGDGDL